MCPTGWIHPFECKFLELLGQSKVLLHLEWSLKGGIIKAVSSPDIKMLANVFNTWTVEHSTTHDESKHLFSSLVCVFDNLVIQYGIMWLACYPQCSQPEPVILLNNIIHLCDSASHKWLYINFVAYIRFTPTVYSLTIVWVFQNFHFELKER